MRNKQIANDWDLWREYMDTNGEMTESKFNALSIEDRMEQLESCFGID